MNDMSNTLLVNTFSEGEIENEINQILRIDWLSDIIEVTYWYVTPEHRPEISYNISLFKDFLKISYEDFFLRGSSYPGLKTAFLQKTNSIIQRFEMVIEQLNNCSEVDIPKKELIIKTNAIRYNIKAIRLAQNGIDFELEKAWMKLNLSDAQIQEKSEIGKALEKELFGWDILDSEEESIWCLRFIEKRLLLEWDKLSEEEKQKMTSFINTFKNTLKEKWYNYVSSENAVVWNKKSTFFQKFWDIKIPRDTYVHIFQEVIDLSWLHQKVIVNPNKWSIYDGPNALEIPANDKFKELSIERVMKLIAHEILWHYCNQRNHEKFFWNIRGSWNVEKEEWLAKFLEYILLWREIWDDEIYDAPFSQIFACEILPGDEFKEFLSMFTKIAEAKTTNEAIFLRRKRNRSMHLIWAALKDTTYSRWLKRIIKFIKEWGDIRLLFNWKFWLDDLISKKVDFSSEEDFLLPIFVPDIIIFYILIEKWLLPTKFTHDNFIIFLKDKYKDSLPWLDFDSVQLVTFFQKRKILMIINNFRDLLREEVSE